MDAARESKFNFCNKVFGVSEIEGRGSTWRMSFDFVVGRGGKGE